MLLSTQPILQYLGAGAPERMAEQDDQELLQRILQRDKQAFALLYDKYAPKILGLARKMLTDLAAAEDATQETFLALWQKAHLYNFEKGALLTWLYRICRNLCLDRMKRPAQEREVNLQPGILSDRILLQPAKENETDPEKLQARINLALKALSAAEQNLIEQAFFAGQSHSEIAKSSGIPLGTVKTRIAAALKKLRHGLGSAWQSGEDI